MKDSGGQSGFCLGLSEDLKKMLAVSRAAGGDYRDGDCRADRVDQLDVKAWIGVIFRLPT